MSIREVQISGYSSRDDVPGKMTEPPEQVLNVAVIQETAFLEVQPMDSNGHAGEAVAAIQVPAKSLVRALRVLIEDDESRASHTA
ncbi:hypothetical protein OU415_38205 [Saccharopolyspora sp. WRP15-2]|uniref:Uncharacterized protein n=1 Tax=Saccharopolyspora oryzae TaxID=2997343 RepID=A0ABT4VBH7_9PSEU|nr:hypothetical protein [Saccharopolyspora oryzae]MDA3631309.1 hypothetical protein [Saccharopolyspora oryzae]